MPANLKNQRSRSDRKWRGKPVGTVAAGAAWLFAVAAMLALLSHYSNTAGNAGSPPARWPADSRIPLDVNGSTLVMIVHPRCPCSRASLGELELLMVGGRGRVSAHVVFLRPDGTRGDWVETDLWRTAAAIPGVTVHRDDGGTEAGRFGSETSGHTLLYDRNGALLFQGGITIARGHAGDNPGRSAIAALLDHGTPGAAGTPVFGCCLANEPRKGDMAWRK